MEGEIEIQLGGQQRKLRFSMWAIEEYDRQIAKINPSSFAAATAGTICLTYAGLANQRRIENEALEKAGKANERKPEYKIESVKHWVYDLYDSEDGEEIVHSVVTAFTNCNAYKNAQKAIKRQEEENKKKLNGMTSEALPLVS